MSKLTKQILLLKFVRILTFVKIREFQEFLKFIKFKFSIYDPTYGNYTELNLIEINELADHQQNSIF